MLHDTRRRGALGELLVAYRFLEVGRLVAWPAVPCAYDLIVDAGDRCYRVQVKQAARMDERADRAAHWNVRLTKRGQFSAKGDTPREVTEFDYLCVVGTPAEIYVIPVAACTSPVDARYLNARLNIGPQSHYRVFLNRFAIGTGLAAEIAPAPIHPARLADVEATKRAFLRARGQRKPHRRLTPAQVEQIRQLPIRWLKSQPPEGLIAIEDAARQFDVCPATLKKVALRRDRLDLRRA